LLEDLSSYSQLELQRIAGSLNSLAKNLFNLLENLLEWSRMQRGLTEFKPLILNVLEQVNDPLPLILEHARQKGIAVQIDIPEDLTIYADKYMIGGIMRNLVYNAVKFTREGGRITITAKPTKDDFILISVIDTGIGMNRQLLHNLFLPGEQSGRKGTAGEPTTGLGLLLCKDFIEKNGGKIRVESTVDKGSAFHFTIPGGSHSKIKHNLSMQPKISSNSDKERVLTLLIADDDDISDILINKIIGKYFHNVYRTLNGRQTLEFIRNHSDIDLIMMDIKMPEMNGYETTRQIRQFNKDIIIIAHTAFGFSNEKEVAVEAGCNDYIPKPLDAALLFATVQNHIPYLQIT
jgi:CheY-like chemotaxis protein